ncbi:MAG TPA: metallophosphoesterase [Capsulimonadaceae bacterium]|nr:metallophosphoesterase [Capsulimonadaceae bacterium]
MPRRIWGLGDTHLSFAHPKPMDIFGPQWQNHPDRIREQCEKLIEPRDLLLIPGDLSWALKRADAEPDLAFLAALPGIKVVCKGNHDYWWDSDRPLRYEGVNDTPFVMDNVGVAGTRGWGAIGPAMTPEERAGTEKIIAREMRRLRKRLEAISHCKHKYAMIHYPPVPQFAPLLQECGVDAVLYGHLHLGGSEQPLPEEWHGVKCLCVAADRIGFTPRLVATLDD